MQVGEAHVTWQTKTQRRCKNVSLYFFEPVKISIKQNNYHTLFFMITKT